MLDVFFDPGSVAVIGAAREPAKLGHAVLSNILQYGFKGKVYPINPKADEVLGLKCYPSVLAVPEPIDLAVIVIPAKLVAGVLEECGQKGVKGVITITAGFRETGSEGMHMEKELIAILNRYGMRMIGPNCLGLIDTIIPINASFAAGMPPQGNIAFMSQSGALCTAILDWSLAESIGFSRFVSLGNKADACEIDFLQAWDADPATKVVIAYLEGITDGPRFMDIARQVTRRTPIIAVKSGGTSAGARAVSSHTGTLAGSEAAYNAAFSQCGVMRADSVEDLFDYSLAFAYQPVLTGDRLAIVTNAGGPGIMATDAIEHAGLKLASLQKETVDRLREFLPPAANFYNPVDVLGDALADRYGAALETVLSDPGVDGVIVLLTPQAMTQIVETAQTVGEAAAKPRYIAPTGSIGAKQAKPVLGCFMGEQEVRKGIRVLAEHKVPNYPFPERAVGAFKAMYRYREWLNRPPRDIPRFEVDQAKVKEVFAQAKADNRLSLGDVEARQVLGAYGLRIPQSQLAKSPDEAVTIAAQLGYPVVMKITSPDILHKSDIGGVKVGLGNATEVRDAFDLIMYRAQRYMPGADIWGVAVQEMVPQGREVIIGMNRDLQFGPLLMFGMGGIYVEVLKDVVFRVAPVTQQEAQEMVQEIRAYPLLRGVRGAKPADMEAVIEAILRVSQLVTDFPEIVELDVNPLMVQEQGAGAIAVDMRIILA
jgi:acetyl coenzyme A synthetase (ADP forming)-like protein